MQDASIIDAKIYENGMVILLSTYQLLHVKGFPEPDVLSENTISANFIASQSTAKALSHNHGASAAAGGNGSGINVDDESNGATARYGKGRDRKSVV